MKKKFLTAFFTFLLTLTMSIVVSANTEPTFHYNYGYDSREMMETSNGYLLLEQAETNYETWEKDTTILRYDEKGKELAKLSLGYGTQTFVKSNGKAYVVFIDDATNNLKVYDETLKLLATNTFADAEVEFKGNENELLYFYDEMEQQKITFNLKTLDFVTSTAKVASAHVYSDEDGVTLRTYDQFEAAFSNVTVAGNLKASNEYSGTQLINDSIYVASTDANSVQVLKLSTDGNVLSTTPVTLPAGTAVDSTYLESIVAEDKIIFYKPTYNTTEEAIVFLFNTTTNSVEYADVKTGQPSYRYVGNGIIREHSYGKNGGTSFYDVNFKKLHSLEPINGSISYPGGNYFILNNLIESDSSKTYYRSDLHDIRTGKFIRTLVMTEASYEPADVSESLLFNNGSTLFFITQKPAMDIANGAIDAYFVQVANKGSVNEIKPTPIGQIVEPTKKWTAKLTQAIDPASVSSATVIVKDAKGQQIDVSLEVEGNQIIITPPANGYAAGNYTLTLQNLKSATGKSLKQSVTKQFSVK